MINDACNSVFYIGLSTYLNSNYPEQSKTISCIIDIFKVFQLEKKFVSLKTMKNLNAASDEIDQFVYIAYPVCKIVEVFTLQIGIAVSILIVFISICCFCCCKYAFICFYVESFSGTGMQIRGWLLELPGTFYVNPRLALFIPRFAVHKIFK